MLRSFLKSCFQVHHSSYFARNLLLEIKTTNVNKSHFQGKCMEKISSDYLCKTFSREMAFSLEVTQGYV